MITTIGGRLVTVEINGDDVGVVAVDPVGPTFDMLLTTDDARSLATWLTQAADLADGVTP